MSALLIPTFSFAAILAVWEIVVRILRVKEYILPKPSTFLPLVYTNRGILWDASLITIKEIALGFALAVLVSVPMGYILSTSKPVEQGFYPLVVFFQLIPKLAVAPLLVIWFGFGLFPKVLLTFIICFFPLLVDSMTGFKSLDVRVLYLGRCMGASRWQALRYIRFPTALPSVFSGLKISVVLATNAAIVGEFIGANGGLGYLLLRSSANLETGLLFAVLVAMCLLGLALSYLVAAAEYLLMPWRRHA